MNSVATSENGRHVVSRGDDGTVIVWDVGISQPVTKLVNKGYLNGILIEIREDGRRVIYEGVDGKLRIWDTETGSETVTERPSRGFLMDDVR